MKRLYLVSIVVLSALISGCSVHIPGLPVAPEKEIQFPIKETYTQTPVRIMQIGRCEYIVNTLKSGDVILTHKGDCQNSIHGANHHHR